MTGIAALDFGGKMGIRLASNLKRSRFEVDHLEPSDEGLQQLLDPTGYESVDGVNAYLLLHPPLPSADLQRREHGRTP